MGTNTAALTVAIACTVFATPVPAQAAPGQSAGLAETIVYTTLRPPNWDIYLFEEPGGQPRRLTDDPALDYNAVFSPDGRWVVFTSERGGNADLYALEIEGENEPIRLTRHYAMDDAAAFSPDGRQLAFVSTREGYADIFLMPFTPGDAGAEARAVNLTRREGGDFNPAFSPDGRRIAFTRQEHLLPLEIPEAGDEFATDHFAVELYVMDADGANPRRISEPGDGPEIPGFGIHLPRVSGSPAWSIQGDAIYYYRFGPEGPEIRRVGTDGSGDLHIAAGGMSPAVRPDGRLAFSYAPPGPEVNPLIRAGQVASVAADGADLRIESDAISSCFAPDFDRGSQRMVCHGPGPVEGLVEIGAGRAFAPPGAVRQAGLPDRILALRGIRGYFPALTSTGEVVSSTMLHAPPGHEGSLPLSISAIDGTGLRERFSPPSGNAWGAAAAGERIVVAVGPPFAAHDAKVDLWMLGSDGTEAVNLTSAFPGNSALPHLSADGRRIVFRRGGQGGDAHVYLIDEPGTEPRRLTDADARETMPALSPDGEWVVFPTDRAGGRKLWIQGVDGTGGRFLEPERLHLRDFSMHPRFSPDGKWVVFVSDRGGFNDEWPLTWFPQPYGELWAVPVAGGPAVRLTHDKWEDGPSDWGFARLPDPSG